MTRVRPLFAPVDNKYLIMNSNVYYLLSGICYPEPASIGSYTPSLDVYGSYFPAWLICLFVGVILTILVSLIRTSPRPSHHSDAWSFGARQSDPDIQYYYLVFVFRHLTIKFMNASQTLRKPDFEIKARAHPVSKKQKPAVRGDDRGRHTRSGVHLELGCLEFQRAAPEDG